MNASASETGEISIVGDLLADVEATIRKYVVLPGDHESTVLALFVAHTYAFDGAHATPYLLVVSPEKRSGKSRLLEVLELLVARPWRLTGASEAAMFRKISKERPTLLMDEIDAVFGSNTERTEPLRALLNAGNRPGASVARCVGERRDEVRDFSVYCPKVLAGIDTGHRISDTIRDRAITVAMLRKLTAEPVERFRTRDVDAQTEPLRQALSEWADGAMDRLGAARPHEPAALDDRAAEAWESLLAIADLAGGEWPERARQSAEALSGLPDGEEQPLGTLLLGATVKAFDGRDRITTANLLNAINEDDELPFGAFRDGQGLDSRGLARFLRPYGVRPRTIRTGDDPNHRGYIREQFSEVWARWLPAPSTEPPQAPQAPHNREAAARTLTKNGDVADVADVAVRTGIANPAFEAPPCRWQTHRELGLDWTNDAAQLRCGVCHPPVNERHLSDQRAKQIERKGKNENQGDEPHW
jgi:hypothetical protein